MQLYKGRLQNGIQVVIRCLLVSKKYTIRNLKLRLDLLAKLRHPHLVCLLGHCLDGGGDDYSVNKVYLVSEYVSNGTFRAKLSGKFGTQQAICNLLTEIWSLISIVPTSFSKTITNITSS